MYKILNSNEHLLPSTIFMKSSESKSCFRRNQVFIICKKLMIHFLVADIMKTAKVQTIIFATILSLVGGTGNFQPLYEWKTDLNHSVQEIVPWRNTWLQVTNENLVYINSIDPRSQIPVNCSFKANFEPGERVRAVSLENEKILIYQFNSIVVVKLPSCARVGTVLKESCKDIISNKEYFDCHYLRPYDYTGPINFGRFNNDVRLIKQFDVPGVASVTQLNLTLEKLEEPRPDRAYYLFEKIQNKCYQDEPNCNLSRFKILDSNYELKEEHAFKHPITQFRSLAHDQFTFCHVEEDMRRTHPEGFFVNVLVCNIYDSRVKLKATARIDLAHEVNDWVERAVAVQNLPDGGVLVFYHPHKKFRKVFYRIIDSSGRVESSEDKEFYEFTSDGWYYEGDIDLYVFEKNPSDRSYCVIMVKFSEIVGKCARF